MTLRGPWGVVSHIGMLLGVVDGTDIEVAHTHVSRLAPFQQRLEGHEGYWHLFEVSAVDCISLLATYVAPDQTRDFCARQTTNDAQHKGRHRTGCLFPICLQQECLSRGRERSRYSHSQAVQC
jgi:hypothetical protein